MSTLSRQLTVQIQSPNVWTQLKEGTGGSVYAVPSSSGSCRADMKFARMINFSSGSTSVDLAISSNGTIATDEYIWNTRVLSGLGSIVDDSVHVMRSGEGLWARSIVSSGSPNVVVRASILEILP
jgi:hypothetical protein